MQRVDDAHILRIVDEGYWRVRLQLGELARNRSMFCIDDGEYQLCSEMVTEVLSKVPNLDLLPDIKPIRSTNGAWKRCAIGDLRLALEPKFERNRFTGLREPVLIWHAVLRKVSTHSDPNWIYGYVAELQARVYPPKEYDRKRRLIREKI